VICGLCGARREPWSSVGTLAVWALLGLLSWAAVAGVVSLVWWLT